MYKTLVNGCNGKTNDRMSHEFTLDVPCAFTTFSCWLQWQEHSHEFTPDFFPMLSSHYLLVYPSRTQLASASKTTYGAVAVSKTSVVSMSGHEQENSTTRVTTQWNRMSLCSQSARCMVKQKPLTPTEIFTDFPLNPWFHSVLSLISGEDFTAFCDSCKHFSIPCFWMLVTNTDLPFFSWTWDWNLSSAHCYGIFLLHISHQFQRRRPLHTLLRCPRQIRPA